jgi:PhnB protein
MQFYARSLGAELHLMKFGDGPQPCPPEAKERIMHARLAKGRTVLMASDNMPGMTFQQGNNFSVSIDCDDAKEAEKYFVALSENGKVTMPLQETFWAERFAMLVDKFGIGWMINLSKPQQ